MQAIWSESGALARVIEGYEHRPQQEEYAAHVQETLEKGGLLLAEAPTGVGKSLAYLVPAVLWALPAGARIVISTNTKNLQDQLHSQDIPKVAALVGHKLRSTVVKGRSNYACARRWRMLDGGQIELPVAGRSVEGLERMRNWMSSTSTGDLGELNAGRSPAVMRLADLVRVEDGMCDPGRCSADEECFLRRLRRRAWNSQLLCVNHAILMGQLLGRWDMLPAFDVMIVDECHNLPRVAADQLGVRLDAGLVQRAARRLMGKSAALGGGAARPRKGRGKAGAALAAAAREAGERGERLFAAMRSVVSRRGERSSVRYREAGEPAGTLLDLGRPFLSACVQVTERLRDSLPAAAGTPEALEEMEGELSQWNKMCEALTRLLNPADGDGVFWIDSSPALRWSPTDVAEHLGPAIDAACEASILTSATLTVGGSFDYFRYVAGLTSDRSCYPRCVSVGSSFDLRKAVLLLVPRDAPDPRQDDYARFVALAVHRVLESTMKKILVLFTSHSMLREVRAELDGRIPGCEILAQGVDGERGEVTRSFKRSRSGILLGAASFWEGVDFPGQEAEVVMIARLPFPVPSEPIVEARSEALQEEGIDPFANYHLPEAVMRLRQGFGRLIRSREDRGVVVILDPRVVRASYARAFLDSLPVEPKVLDGVDAVAAAAAGWFKEVDEHA